MDLFGKYTHKKIIHARTPAEAPTKDPLICNVFGNKKATIIKASPP